MPARHGARLARGVGEAARRETAGRFRLHATLRGDDQRGRSTSSRGVNRETPLAGLHWFHRPRRDDQSAQHRPASAPSAAASRCSTAWPTRARRFIERYGKRGRAAIAPPIRRMLAGRRSGRRGAPMRRASRATTRSLSLYWLVTGQDRRRHIALWRIEPARPHGSAAAVDGREVPGSSSEGKTKEKARSSPGSSPNLAVLSADYFRRAGGLRSSALEVRASRLVGGKPVYAAAEFRRSLAAAARARDAAMVAGREVRRLRAAAGKARWAAGAP